MKLSRIHKIYLSNFLTGLVFWYGVEKLFMGSIGIDAVGVGIATAVLIGFNFIFDIPSGILADRWSRKGMLIVSAVALALCSVVAGVSNGLWPYVLSDVLYGVYVVATSGTYQALTYDILHQEGRADQYSKISGRAYALFLVGAGVANIASGFIAQHTSLRTAFFITVVSCALNIVLISSIKEPTFHKTEAKAKVLAQLGEVTKTLVRVSLLRVLAIVMSALTVADLFMSEFGQLYMLHYVSELELIGLLWAAYAFAWALGSLFAHRFHARLSLLVCATTLPFIAMAFIDSSFSLILFMLQAGASAALVNQIETRVQRATPSAVRASILSVFSALGRAVSVPASLLLGWLFKDFGALAAVQFIAGVCAAVLLFWFLSLWRHPSIQKTADHHTQNG
jgi:MFS family permease